MNQFFERSACFAFSANNRNLNFIANRNYPLRYHVGSFGNDLTISTTQFCVIQSRARLLQFMADALKSNFQLIIPKEQISGELNDQKEWNGMMKLFNDKTIDFAFNDFSYQKVRKTVVKFSVPIEINYRFAILSRKSLMRHEFNILSIFDVKIWLVMLLFFLFCLLVVFFVFQIKDISKVVLEFVGIFLGLGTVIDTVNTYIPRAILGLWIMGTLIFTFILRNEILALFSARHVDKIDSVDDVKVRNLKVLVQNDTNRWLFNRLNSHNIVPIVWTDFWTVATMEKILAGSHVLVFNEDKLEVMANDPEYSLRISDEKKDMRFGFYLFRLDMNQTLTYKVNKCIKAMAQSGIYLFLKINSFREYVMVEKRKNIHKTQALSGQKRHKSADYSEDPRKVRNLQFSDIEDSFPSLFYGWIVSYVALFGELLLDRVRTNVVTSRR